MQKSKRQLCSVCGSIATMNDGAGLHWCEEHRHRGDLLSWAAQRQYPGIRFTGTNGRYAISLTGDEYARDMWVNAVLFGNEDAMWSALSKAMSEDIRIMPVGQWNEKSA